jgi:transcriptional regulator with XRE-family HTH domain
VKTVGERIRQAREARALTQAELATRVGFKNQSAIGNLEARATGRGGFRLAEIAAVLSVPVQWLLDGPDTGEVPASSDEIRPALQSAISLNARKVEEPSSPRETAKKLIDSLPEFAIREAIEYLEYLSAKYKQTQNERAGNNIPAQNNRAA